MLSIFSYEKFLFISSNGEHVSNVLGYVNVNEELSFWNAQNLTPSSSLITLISANLLFDKWAFSSWQSYCEKSTLMHS